VGSLLALWAMACNCYFIGMMRNQTERSVQLVQSGPYRYVLHPGYPVSLYLIAFTLLMFGSLVGLILAGLTCG
jgi:protein-S-isoprenylcysteine O-methyltransferase Ste14